MSTPRIVDSHIHLYPSEVSADPRIWGEARREPWWTRCVDPPHQRTLQGWATVDRLLQDMDDAGVERSVMLGWYWENQETCELQNAWYAAWVQAHPDRLSGFATVQPNAGARALENLERSIDAGLCGIGEIKPQAQHFRFEDETWAAIVGFAQERDLPINLHVTDPLMVTPDSLALETPLLDFLNLVKAFPEVSFILAHWGGGLPFYELNQRVKKRFRNVYYDTAASPLLYDPAVYRRVLDLVGPDRILFGTDYPLLCYPKRSREPEFRRHITDVVKQDLPADTYRKIMGQNTLRLLNLQR